MWTELKVILVAFFATATAPALAALNDNCPPADGVALQILGSGGPIADDGRASAGYLIWVDGASRVLIDAGGGTFLRFGEAGADFTDLDFIGISHFHADHSADLAAILKSGYFANRLRALVISGPAAGGPFPGLESYIERLFGGDSGAYGYLSSYFYDPNTPPNIAQYEIAPEIYQARTLLGDHLDELQISTTNVPHGIVPAVAYRVRFGSTDVVFASDQNGSDERFVEFARDADILVMHMAVPEHISGAGRKLHAPPSVIGEIAESANVSKLVLSHFMARSLKELEKNVSIVRSRFSGAIVVAEDLQCIVTVN